jgi:beta-lactamase regulating signal transducer with metallopeptidase domain
MNLLLETAIKVSLVVALGLLAASLLRRGSASLRHWMLAASMAAALATPLLVQWAPAWRLPVAAPVTSDARGSGPERTTSRREPRIGITTSVDGESLNTAPTSLPFDPTSLVIGVWLAGVVVNLSGLLLGFWRLRRIAAAATVVREGPWAVITRLLSAQFGLRRSVTLLQSDRPASLVTWGCLAPKVLLPNDAASWDPDRIRIVLAHELAHVRRHDWIIQIGAELVRIANWFNPLVWLASARLRLESERACDDAVVNLGVSGREYAEHLLDLARQFGRAGRVPFPAVSIVPRPSNLERRVTAMLNARVSRRPISPIARAATIAALLAVAIPIALFAQNTFVTLSGSIADQSGGVLPGVTVVATDRDRGVKHETRTDAAGRFEIIGLPQGGYALQASLPGFQNFEQQLTLSGEDIHRDITLSIGMLQETISVTSGPSAGPFPPRGPYKPRPANCGPAGPRATAAPPRDGALRVGGQIRQPAKLYHVAPVYPDGSSPGVVIMQAVIGPDGYVSETTLLRDPSPALSQSAVDAVKQWVFEPTLLNCVAVPVRMVVTVDFN